MQPEVTRLLKRGLNHYGLGDLEAAIACWEEALAADPKNRAAADYLASARAELGEVAPKATRKARKPSKPVASAGAKAGAREGADHTPRTLDAVRAVASLPEGDDVARALELYKADALEEAYALLEDVARRQPERLDVEGYLAMIRGKRARGWARTVGDQGRALRVVMRMDQLVKLDLRPDEGYLLGQIDGVTSIEQLLSMSRDRVRALEIVAHLLSEGVVE